MYAALPIRKGTKIIEYTGIPVPKEDEYSDKYNDDLKAEAHTFLFYVDKDLTIDATDIDNPAKYINHSCDPNCESVIQGKRVFIKAVRSIRPGEELTYDYALFSTEKWKRYYWKRYLCRCGAYKCRGIILRKPRPPRAELVKWRRKYRQEWKIGRMNGSNGS